MNSGKLGCSTVSDSIADVSHDPKYHTSVVVVVAAVVVVFVYDRHCSKDFITLKSSKYCYVS